MRRALISVIATALLAVGPAAAGPPGPHGQSAFQLRLGVFMPAADSGFWDETQDTFTLDESDFNDFVFGMSFVHSLSNTVELGFNADFFSESADSSYRDFDEGGFPISHDTELSLYPLTFDVRFLPGGRYRMRPGGRQVLKPTFYVGAGLGLNFWEYDEDGDFIDFSDPDLPIFFGHFSDDGTAFELHVLAGAEIPLGYVTNLLIEGRYSESEDELGGDFAGLDEDEIDLGGTAIYAGLAFHF